MLSLEDKIRSDMAAAQQQQVAIRGEIAKLQNKLDKLAWQADYMASMLKVASEQTGAPQSATSATDPPVQREVGVGQKPTAKEMVVSVLREAGKALQLCEITDLALARMDSKPDRRNHMAALSSMLARSIKDVDTPFVKDGRGVFGLREWQSSTVHPTAATPLLGKEEGQ